MGGERRVEVKIIEMPWLSLLEWNPGEKIQNRACVGAKGGSQASAQARVEYGPGGCVGVRPGPQYAVHVHGPRDRVLCGP